MWKRMKWRLFCWWYSWCPVHKIELEGHWAADFRWCKQCDIEKAARIERRAQYLAKKLAP